MQKDRTASLERRGDQEGSLEEVILEHTEELSWECSGTSAEGFGRESKLW